MSRIIFIFVRHHTSGLVKTERVWATDSPPSLIPYSLFPGFLYFHCHLLFLHLPTPSFISILPLRLFSRFLPSLLPLSFCPLLIFLLRPLSSPLLLFFLPYFLSFNVFQYNMSKLNDFFFFTMGTLMVKIFYCVKSGLFFNTYIVFLFHPIHLRFSFLFSFFSIILFSPACCYTSVSDLNFPHRGSMKVHLIPSYCTVPFKFPSLKDLSRLFSRPSS